MCCCGHDAKVRMTLIGNRLVGESGNHEKRIGAPDPNWLDGYGNYILAEQSG